MKVGLIAGILVLAGSPAFGHRLDEYLQGMLLSVDKDRVEASMTLTPGIAVFPFLIADMDTDGNGAISEAEQRAYAGRVLRDLSLTSDGRSVTPKLLSLSFPPIADMKEGRGEIRLSYRADLPPGGRNRELTIENRHQSRISAYQVNCLVPVDPHIQISAQTRNYSQSHYQLEYVRTDVSSATPPVQMWSGGALWPSLIGLLLITRFMYLKRRYA